MGSENTRIMPKEEILGKHEKVDHTAFCGHRYELLRLCYQYNAALSQGLKSLQMA
jgi:hypothetical protein